MIIILALTFNSLAMLRNVKVYEQMIENHKKQFTIVNNTLASVRVKHGQTWETFVPLMAEFEQRLGPKENAVFLGQPIDLIYFNKDEVVFVEVKTGNSRLSSRQRHIRKLIENRQVRWEEVYDALKPVVPNVDRPASADMLTTVPHRQKENM